MFPNTLHVSSQTYAAVCQLIFSDAFINKINPIFLKFLKKLFHGTHPLPLARLPHLGKPHQAQPLQITSAYQCEI
jgi:hypothetical protein